MKTLEQIKAEIIASNPARVYVINGEKFEQTDAEFNDAIQKRAEMEYEILLLETTKAQAEAEAAVKKAAAQAKLAALGLTPDDLQALGL